jgi:hypothetical protein
MLDVEQYTPDIAFNWCYHGTMVVVVITFTSTMLFVLGSCSS